MNSTDVVVSDVELADGIWLDAENVMVVVAIDRMTVSLGVDEFDHLAARIAEAQVTLETARNAGLAAGLSLEDDVN